MKRFVRISIAIFFILLGILGLVLPILQGTPFIFLGLSILSPSLANRLKIKYFSRWIKEKVLLFQEFGQRHVLAGVTTRHFLAPIKSSQDLDHSGQQDLLIASLGDSLKKYREKLSKYRLYYAHQVHGDRVVSLDDQPIREASFICVGEADAMVTTQPHCLLLAFSADCLTLFYYTEPQKGSLTKRAVAIAHAGWRGTKLGVAIKTYQALKQMSGARDEEINIVLGPRISQKHYQVGEEFYEHFQSSKFLTRNASKQVFFDLAGENRAQLIGAGAWAKRIVDSRFCTQIHSGYFWSHRREKEKASRHISFIGLE